LPTDIFASSITTVVFTVKKLTKMKKIAIIGAAGNMGSNIARNLSKAGYSINLSDNDADKLTTFQAELAQLGSGTITISPTPVAAVQQSDVVILAVWHGVQETIADQIRSAVQGKIVVSIANPLNDTYDGLTTASNTSSAEELAALLPNAKVVKSFNTVFAGDFQNTTLDGKQVDCFVAGDDESAVKSVEQLVADSGFNPLVAGKLSASRTLENMTVMLIGLSQRYGYNWVAGWKVLSNNVSKMAAIFLMAVMMMSMTTVPTPTTFKMDAAKSSFKWTGKKVAGTHWGYVKFSDGSLQIQKGALVGGTFNVDMTTIDCQDTQGEWGQKLVGHLKSDDFFNVEKFQKSTLTIKTVTPKGANQYDVVADLTIKGVSKDVKFTATVIIAGATATATADFKIDRTDYGIRYGSGSFFDNLGDKAIDNTFNVEVNIVATGDVPTKKSAKKGKPSSK
jgi:8-hydroxy-5-deazaflavin:NADPH oxidoreductase